MLLLLPFKYGAHDGAELLVGHVAGGEDVGADQSAEGLAVVEIARIGQGGNLHDGPEHAGQADESGCLIMPGLGIGGENLGQLAQRMLVLIFQDEGDAVEDHFAGKIGFLAAWNGAFYKPAFGNETFAFPAVKLAVGYAGLNQQILLGNPFVYGNQPPYIGSQQGDSISEHCFVVKRDFS